MILQDHDRLCEKAATLIAKKTVEGTTRYGKVFEVIYALNPLVETYGYILISNDTYVKYKNTKELPPRFAVVNYEHTNYDGCESKLEFFLVANNIKESHGLTAGTLENPFTCALECKFQDSSGSTEEKFNHTLHTLEHIEAGNAILLAEVDGMRACRFAWVAKAIDTRFYRVLAQEHVKDKRFKLFGTKQFDEWLLASHR